jgi:DNA-binding transcriptional LysR family regulator
MGKTCYVLIHMVEPLESAELLAFTKTVESKSLSRAAIELGVPRATVSRRLARLEEQLGVRLLRRTTRSLVLTEAGSSFYRQACIALASVEQARESVRVSVDVPRGDLRVSAPPFASESFSKLICDFIERHPAVRLHLHLSTVHVDLRRDGYDVAIRAAGELEPGLVARTLVKNELMAVASPAYLAAHGTPRVARELRDHRCLLGFARGEVPQTYWPVAGGRRLHVEGVFSTNDVVVLRDAVVRGLGVALMPRMLIESELSDRSVVQVLAGVIGAQNSVSVVYPEREYVPAQVRAFVDAIVAWAPRELGLQTLAARREKDLVPRPVKKRPTQHKSAKNSEKQR